ncbi:MAG: hypothetical protein J0I48_04150 [Devosia sp.]|uniref:hypothetical protein n=1 Tax=Devosia sp. 66-22 TaxID=1895753 RepID=UPI000929207B|nr:hypothetical protein [Devosia sp. 66-22]MBN9345385.1 hypothetical protein [Devosia sp.]OJX49244.1 MAG: hypothetical protein BGO81_05415 [Devosia sp. 66-22]
MPLSEDFGIAARGSPSPTPRKRQPPFGLRLTVEERERLEREAAGLPLGAYIKSRVLGTPVLGRARRSGLPVADREAHAQAVALLGRSRLASNLNQLARAVHIGVLPTTPETEAELLRALGLQAEGGR